MTEKLTGLAKDYFNYATAVRLNRRGIPEYLETAKLIEEREKEIREYFEKNKNLDDLIIKGLLGRKSDKKRRILELILKEGLDNAIRISIEEEILAERSLSRNSFRELR